MDRYYTGSSSSRHVSDAAQVWGPTEAQRRRDYTRSFPSLSEAPRLSAPNRRSQGNNESPPRNADILAGRDRGSTKVYNTAYVIERDCDTVLQALKCLEALNNSNLTPSPICYTNFIKVHHKSIPHDEAGKEARALQAVAVLDEMHAIEIPPNAIHFSAVITACEALGQQNLVQQVLQRGVNERVFEESLGFLARRRKLDFHEKTVAVGGGVREQPVTVPPAVVRAILDYHWDNLNKSEVKFIVGENGMDRTRAIVEQYIESKGYTALPCYKKGKLQKGLLRAG